MSKPYLPGIFIYDNHKAMVSDFFSKCEETSDLGAAKQTAPIFILNFMPIFLYLSYMVISWSFHFKF